MLILQHPNKQNKISESEVSVVEFLHDLPFFSKIIGRQ